MVLLFHDILASVLLFFFKRKTAYEMRISDWSSDVCSSDLDHADFLGRVVLQQAPQHVAHAVDRAGRLALLVRQWRQRVKCAKQPRRAIDQEDRKSVV